MSPMRNSTQLSTLKVGSNIQRHANVDSTVGTMNGSSIEARTTRLPRKLRFSSSASHMPSVSLNTVAHAVYQQVFQKAVWKIESCQAFTKLRAHTKCPTVPTLGPVRARHTP